MNRTPGPIRVGNPDNHVLVAAAPDGGMSIDDYLKVHGVALPSSGRDKEEGIANRDHIVRCWNACEPDGPVQRLIEVSEKLANEYNFYELDEAAAEVKQALGEQE